MTGRREPEPMDQLVGRRLRQLGIAAGAHAAWYCQQADALAAGRYTAVRFRDSTLTLKAANPIIAHELRLQQDQLEQSLRAALKWPERQPFRIRIVL